MNKRKIRLWIVGKWAFKTSANLIQNNIVFICITMVAKKKEENTTLSFTKKRIEQKKNQIAIYININSSN